jgi:hypothetical protein
LSNRLDGIDDEDNDSDGLDSHQVKKTEPQNPNDDRNEIVLDASHQQFEITQLNRNLTYVIELYALSKYNPKLLSQPVRLYLKLNEYLRDATAPTVQINDFTMEKIYFQNGLVKARLKWSSTGNPEGNLTYSLTWFPIKCQSNENLIAPISAQTNKFTYEIYELMYDCDYVVNLRVLDTKLKLSPIQLKIPKCTDIEIVGKLKPFCELNVKQRMQTPLASVQLDRVEDLTYRILNKNFKLNVFDVEFEWSRPTTIDDFDAKILGYQVNIRNLNKTNDSISSLVNKDKKHFSAKNLKLSFYYVFSIQLIDRLTLALGKINTVQFLIENQNDLSLKQHHSINQATSKKNFKPITNPKTRLNPLIIQPLPQPLPSLLHTDYTAETVSPFVLSNDSLKLRLNFNLICIFLLFYIFIF